jgi:Tfp pilus assembly PilM family ATPase
MQEQEILFTSININIDLLEHEINQVINTENLNETEKAELFSALKEQLLEEVHRAIDYYLMDVGNGQMEIYGENHTFQMSEGNLIKRLY